MAQLIGLARLGRDAEVRTTGNGDSVANLSLAFNYGRKGEDGKKPTQWIDAALWGKRAEALEQYLVKGQLLSVTIDDPHIETYKTRDGGEASKLAGTISQIEFAGSPPESSGSREAAPASRREAAPAPAPRGRAAAPAPAAHSKGGSTGFDDMDDDVPFITSSFEYDTRPRSVRKMARYDY